MKKIENAAWIHCGGAELYREKFIAGASYVFDEMASEDAVTVAAKAMMPNVDASDISGADRQIARRVLNAVRKWSMMRNEMEKAKPSVGVRVAKEWNKTYVPYDDELIKLAELIDRAIRREKAKAWDEAALDYCKVGDPTPFNPYRGKARR